MAAVSGDGVRRHCYQTGSKSQVGDAVFDSSGAAFGVAVFVSRSTQDLQRSPWIAEHQEGNVAQIDAEFLNLKFKKQKRFAQNRDVGQLSRALKLQRLAFCN
jgi:hypothetical protein